MIKLFISLLLIIFCIQHSKTNQLNNSGKKDGLWIEKYANGLIKTAIIYKNGLFNGSYKSYYDNGNIQTIANYCDSIRNGDQYVYFHNGSLNVHSKYKMGNCLFFKTFDESGKASIEDYYFKNGKIKASLIIENGDTILYKH